MMTKKQAKAVTLVIISIINNAILQLMTIISMIQSQKIKAIKYLDQNRFNSSHLI